MFQPLHNYAFRALLDGGVGHGCGWGCAMPMLFSGRKPHYIARSNLFDFAAFALRPAASSRNNQCLAERMGMPRSPCARLEGYAVAGHPRRVRRLKEWIDPDRAGKPVRRALSRRLRAGAFNFHAQILKGVRGKDVNITNIEASAGFDL